MDVTSTAKEVGFRYPVAMTCQAFHEAVTLAVAADKTAEPVTPEVQLVVALGLLKAAVALMPEGSDRVSFTVPRVGGKASLYAVCGPGDTPEPVVTVCVEGED